MTTDTFIEHLKALSEWQHQHMGRQSMQVAILKWGVDNRAALLRAGLADSLIAAMDAEIALHSAARPSAQ